MKEIGKLGILWGTQIPAKRLGPFIGKGAKTVTLYGVTIQQTFIGIIKRQMRDEHDWEHQGHITGETNPFLAEGTTIEILECKHCDTQTVGNGNGEQHEDWNAGECQK